MTKPNGRYRFQGGRPLDPDAGIHPEIAAESGAGPIGAGIPNTPQELIAMQENKPERPEKSERQKSAKVEQVLDCIRNLDTSDGEDLQVALAIVAHLERLHDEVVAEMRDDDDARHTQIIGWAVDADRLYRARLLLESVDLE